MMGGLDRRKVSEGGRGTHGVFIYIYIEREREKEGERERGREREGGCVVSTEEWGGEWKETRS
jgi:hypothetical protein